VLDSAGSVVPLFRRQIAEGGPVTVTHPEVKRYFMTIPEACQLIMQAASIGGGGEIFVLDMGEPVKIRYLAEQMILLAGKRPGPDVEIVYTGLRPGEKLFEELFHAEERLSATSAQKVLLARSRPTEPGRLAGALERIERAAAGFDEVELKAVLGELVPEYVPGQAAPSNVVPLAAAQLRPEPGRPRR
jgi:FlaA1/EpsC-like NDP-sugar epimerase